MTRRPISFFDLFLMGTAMALSIRWIAAAAAAGPSSLPLWGLAALGFMAPLVMATAEMTSRFPGEGGLYDWTREMLGPLPGFVCGWLYWTCNLPFFCGLLYFIVTVAAMAAGPNAEAAARDPALMATAAIGIAAVVGLAHLAGLGTGKWLANLGAWAGAILIAVLAVAGVERGAAGAASGRFAAAAFAPPLTADGAALWATMVFAFGGPEALAFLRGQVQGGVPRILAVLAAVGAFLTICYVAATWAMIVTLPAGEISRLAGAPDAVRASLAQIGLASFARPALALFAMALIGSYSAWFGVAARLPRAMSADRRLPAAFARLSPTTGAPTLALVVQIVCVAAFVVLGQAGATVKAAYDFLVSMSVISYTLPFVLLFLAFLKVQARAAPAGAWTAPGGPAAGRVVAVVGLVFTVSAILATLVPSPDATDPAASTMKLVIASAVLILSGVVLFFAGARRAAAIA